MFDVEPIQQALRQWNLDGWLLFDFRGSNPLARKVLRLDPQQIMTRRMLYCIPADGPPRKLVHRIESAVLDDVPGERHVYLTWQQFEQGVATLLGGMKTVAMEYSPRNANPYVSCVDAGIVELVRDCGVDVVSSGDLIQQFESTWTDRQWQLHQQSAELTGAAFERVWRFIAERIRADGELRETDAQQVILDHFAENGMVTDHPPIVAVGPHAGDPHYDPQRGNDATMREGDLVLVDLWAKLDEPDGVFSDYTRMGFIGREVPARFDELFAIVARARDAGIACVQEALAADRPLEGWEVDAATRRVIDEAGYGEHFCHRTGHNIGGNTHGNGAHMDNLETHEQRRVLPRTCFSIEPGLYFDDSGFRSEVNVYIDADNQVHVTGPPMQQTILPILRDY